MAPHPGQSASTGCTVFVQVLSHLAKAADGGLLDLRSRRAVTSRAGNAFCPAVIRMSWWMDIAAGIGGAGLGRPRWHSVGRSVSSLSVAPSNHTAARLRRHGWSYDRDRRAAGLSETAGHSPGRIAGLALSCCLAGCISQASAPLNGATARDEVDAPVAGWCRRHPYQRAGLEPSPWPRSGAARRGWRHTGGTTQFRRT